MKISFKEDKCPVPILQDEWEFGELMHFFLLTAPRTILEIGSFFGGTLWYWIKYGGRNLEQLVSIDLPIPKGDSRYAKMVESKNKWNSWIRRSIDFTRVEANSTNEQTISKVERIFQNEGIDFLFIDGGHDANTVYADYINYAHMVNRDGLIVFHDIISEKGVKLNWDKIKIGQRHVEIVNTLGIGIIYAN